MENAKKLRDKLTRGEIAFGTGVTFADATVAEALCGVVDFIWPDMEHTALTLAAVQGHVMATKGTDTAALVRVAENDPVLIKPVLDLGADGVIVPLVRTADDVRRAVAACKYPPEGVRGFGPRRPSDYGRTGGPDFMRAANDAVLTIVQIEHADAVANLDAILAVSGLAALVIGPNDLSASMGHPGEPRHPEVVRTVENVLTRAAKAGVPAGLAGGGEPDLFQEWIRKGARWVAMGADFLLLLRAATQLRDGVRQGLAK